MATIRFGTYSWSEESWVGPFYPAGTEPGDYLAHYGAHFDSVEADCTLLESASAGRRPQAHSPRWAGEYEELRARVEARKACEQLQLN